ncbi:MAG: hypothetical protein QG556_635 [Pseudomonadota bacterium]|nr:hypothetical protein [Pseudomonadota bacterium]
MDIGPWCDELTARLPELLWKLPVWPKNYRSYVPWGLFEIKDDWTPQMAIGEIQQKTHQLRQMSAYSAQAQYLSRQIFQQVQVLVLLSHKLPSHAEYVFEKKAITRADYQRELQEQIYILELQKQALERSALQSDYAKEIRQEIEKVSYKINELKGFLGKN